MIIRPVILITGSRKGIGRYLTEYYLRKGWMVVGCSREASNLKHSNYKEYQVDITDEGQVDILFTDIRRTLGRIDVLINNAGIASMNHSLLTTTKKTRAILETNILGTFLFCREAAKIMSGPKTGRIVNFTTVAVPLKLEGEAIYTASKAAVESLTQVLAREFSYLGITVNAIGPVPVQTDLIKNVGEERMKMLMKRIPLKQMSTMEDISNVIDFFIKPESKAITGQIIYLGGV